MLSLTALHILIILLIGSRLFLRDNLSPDTRLAWLFVVMLFPYFGGALYFLFGKAKLGKRQLRAFQAAEQQIAAQVLHEPMLLGKTETLLTIPARYRAPFQYLSSINGFYPVSGCFAELLANGDAARARLIADIDAAEYEVCVLYYIWLNDCTGEAVADALIRAAKRGVVCRALADGLGSHAFIHSETWHKMQQAGVQTRAALPVRQLFGSRIDLRNHRKITLIDGKITHCGSQNCADAEFLVKARYAPWVDIMMRFSGSIAAQMRLLFATDWIMAGGEILPELAAVKPVAGSDMLAQVMGAGSTARTHATPQFLVNLISCAQHELTISTPYFVPDATVLNALCATALRGVKVTLIVPEKNDSWVVAAASRSYYRLLLQSGVHIREFHGGMLHAKTLTLDGCITFIGSSNLDLRSFDLNFENNILFHDSEQTQAVYRRQQDYLAASCSVTLDNILQWHRSRRIFHNVIASVSPLL